VNDGIDLLRALVDLPSGSGDADGIERCGDLVRPRLLGLGFELERHVLGAVPHIVAQRAGPASAPHALLVSHLDTVIADPSWTFTVDGPLGRGPAVADPYGGVVAMLLALELLAETGELARGGWTVVLNGDEEIGSPASGPLLERLAAEATAGFVFESGRADGSLVGSRAGSAVYRLETHGKAAHSGVNPADGASAILALAHLIIAAEATKDLTRGLSVNVGTCHGGLKRNQVPDEASAAVDVRFRAPEDGARVQRRLAAAASEAETHVPGTRAEARLVGGRPAWRGGEGTDRLVGCWLDAARSLGLEGLRAVHTGGGSDGNILAAEGLPCLDGLGAVGGGYHTREEWVVLESVEGRARLAARGLLRWLELCEQA